MRELFLEGSGVAKTELISIACHVLSVPKERLLTEPERRLDEGEGTRIRDLIGERRRGKPLAYLTNRREFFSETFYVDERVLIPRPETELLVEEALSIVRSRGCPVRVLDMGAGSGIIGILLAKGGAGRVLSVDISPDALAVARRNARALSVEDRIDFVTSDLFSAMRQDRLFDLVCANLPYVSPDEWEGLMTEVRCFEPRQALLGGEQGLELYRRFVPKAVEYLLPGGSILCEIGGEAQANVVGGLLKKAGLEATVKHDLAGRQRVVTAHG